MLKLEAVGVKAAVSLAAPWLVSRLRRLELPDSDGVSVTSTTKKLLNVKVCYFFTWYEYNGILKPGK